MDDCAILFFAIFNKFLPRFASPPLSPTSLGARSIPASTPFLPCSQDGGCDDGPDPPKPFLPCFGDGQQSRLVHNPGELDLLQSDSRARFLTSPTCVFDSSSFCQTHIRVSERHSPRFIAEFLSLSHLELNSVLALFFGLSPRPAQIFPTALVGAR